MALQLPRPPASPRRLAYLGTPDAAVAPLRALVDSGYEVAVVVSQPDRRRGRGSATQASPVKAAATELGLAVSDRVADIVDAEVDLGVVVAYGRLIKPPVLEVVPLVNIHFSLLPRWRGAAPVERAILAGDEETGVCLMQLEEGLDTGPVYARASTPIGPEETAAELRRRLTALGSSLLLAELSAGRWEAEAQRGEATYADKIRPEEHELHWLRPAVELHRVVRIGGAWTTFRGKRLKVHGATLESSPVTALAPGELDGVVVGTGSGCLRLTEVQAEGKAAQAADAWRNGARPAPGERLGAEQP